MMSDVRAVQSNDSKILTAQNRSDPYAPSLVGLLIGAREAMMTSIRPILHEAGVTQAQWRVLRILFEHGPCESARVARHALLHPPSVSRIIKELDQRRLVVREKGPGGSRRSLLLLSEEGRQLVLETRARMDPVYEFCTVRFGRKRLAALEKELAAFTLAVHPELFDEMTTVPPLRSRAGRT